MAWGELGRGEVSGRLSRCVNGAHVRSIWGKGMDHKSTVLHLLLEKVDEEVERAGAFAGYTVDTHIVLTINRTLPFRAKKQHTSLLLCILCRRSEVSKLFRSPQRHAQMPLPASPKSNPQSHPTPLPLLPLHPLSRPPPSTP